MDPRCDQSLGVVMYETATGRRPLGESLPCPRLSRAFWITSWCRSRTCPDCLVLFPQLTSYLCVVVVLKREDDIHPSSVFQSVNRIQCKSCGNIPFGTLMLTVKFFSGFDFSGVVAADMVDLVSIL